MLLGVATGLLGGTAALTVEHARMRPDVAIALVVGFPSAVGLLVVLLARRRWLTALGAFILAVGAGMVRRARLGRGRDPWLTTNG